MERAVIDRFEGQTAILLVGDDERRVNVPRRALPRGARESIWLQVEFEGDRLVSAVIDQAETERVKSRISEKLERLRREEHLR